MTTDTPVGFNVGSEYIYTGLVTGPYKVHKSTVTLTYEGDCFHGRLQQDNETVTFKVNIIDSTSDKFVLKSDKFALPSTSELSNLEMICEAALSETKLIGNITIPAYSVLLTLDLDRAL